MCNVKAHGYASALMFIVNDRRTDMHCLFLGNRCLELRGVATANDN